MKRKFTIQIEYDKSGALCTKTVMATSADEACQNLRQKFGFNFRVVSVRDDLP